MKRKAVMVGIDHYSWAPLKTCVNDAAAVEAALRYHHNEEVNFNTALFTSDQTEVTTDFLRQELRHLFAGEAEMALFYFSGHGDVYDGTPYLITQSSTKSNPGLPMAEIVEMVANTRREHVKEIVIILDCCHAGHAAGFPFQATDANGLSITRKGISVLAGTLGHEYSVADSSTEEGHGIFTRALLDGLRGQASNVLGWVTIGGLYNYIDQVLGPFRQRPIFKTHVTSNAVLSKSGSKISPAALHKITRWFPTNTSAYQLERSDEPTEQPEEPYDEAKLKNRRAVFATLQKFCRHGLVEPVGHEHMYYACINESTCKLTALGQAYWQMVKVGTV